MSPSPKKGLGRGFASLIPTDLLDDTFDPTAKQDEQLSELRYMPLAQIHADPTQPRQTFDPEALAELTESVREHGVLQPLVVTPVSDGFQIVAGERRFRAASAVGLEAVPVLVRTVTAQNKLELSLIENIQRRDLNTVETATAYAKLRDQFNLSTEAIAQRVHKSPSAIINTMRLLKLPKDVLVLIAEGSLSQGQARPLIGLDAAVIAELIPRIISEEWSARKIEQYMVNLKAARNDDSDQKSSSDATVSEYETQISSLKARLSADISVRVNSKGVGKIVIPFTSADEFERLRSLLDK